MPRNPKQGLSFLIAERIKKWLEHPNNEKLRLSVIQAIPFWVASLLVGLVTAMYAQIFSFAEHLMFTLFEWKKSSIFFIMPFFMIIAWMLTKKYASNARGSGIPQVMASIDIVSKKPHANIDKLLSIRILIVKVISSVFMALSGAAVGREGPTIQISASIFSFIHRLIPHHLPKVRRSNMIVAGAAAGLAAAFNTPLGGIVFAIEELSRTHVSFYRTALFSGVIIAGLTAQSIVGPYLYLGFPDVNGVKWYIFFYVIVVAVFGGLLAAYCATIILRILKWKKSILKNRVHHFLFIVICAAILSCIAYFLSPTILGSGKNLMQHLLFTNDKTVHWYDFPLRYFGPLISFVVGSAGGIFAPSLAAGAALGATFGDLIHLQGPEMNLVILAGMVAFLTGITRSPFTSAILVLEMTDRHSVIIYLMLAGMISNIAALIVSRKSLYDELKQDFANEYNE